MFRFIWSWLVYTWGGLHRYFGNKNRLMSEYESAVYYFGRAFEIDPRFRQARLARAVLLWRELGRVDEALAELDALLQDDPAYSLALFNRALARQENGRYAQALSDLEAYLQLPPEHGHYHDEASRLAALLREIEE